ncbi:MAG: hypothetical protein Q8P70_01585 [bacterium]|nr:hypothetical protein [bacterium]
MRKNFPAFAQRILEHHILLVFVFAILVTLLVSTLFFMTRVYLVQKSAGVGERVLLEFRGDLMEEIRKEWRWREEAREESPPLRDIFSPQANNTLQVDD